MKNLFIWVKIFVFLIIFGPIARAQDPKKMIAHFINVGQADATLLEFPCGAILIDAGAQGPQQEQDLIDYLHTFFERRSDLNNTLDLVIITHAHLDHNLALDNVVHEFTIKRYIDNGLKAGSGSKNQKWLQDSARDMGIIYANYSYEKITAGGNNKGLTNTTIDPIKCDEVDPKILLLSGNFSKKPSGWSQSAYQNGNNRSIVIKVIFGNASFLFTGDLETDGIKKLLNTYTNSMLDVDILRVGHHGAANATTPEYLNAVTPTYAVISCGKWSYGKKGPGKFNTYNYGHPRIMILDQLAASVPGKRSSPVTIKAATAAKKFINYTVTKRIYATPWDESIQIETDDNANYRVMLNH